VNEADFGHATLVSRSSFLRQVLSDLDVQVSEIDFQLLVHAITCLTNMCAATWQDTAIETVKLVKSVSRM